MKKLPLFMLLAGLTLPAQQLDLTSLDKLDTRAADKAKIAMDTNTLRLAAQFLSAEDAAEQQTKNLVASIKGIFVRSYEFKQAGEFGDAEIEPIRRQLRAPGWVKVIDVKDGNESAEIYFFSQNDKYGGLAVLAVEPREIAVVNIVGPIDLNALSKLSGTLGIPNIDIKAFGGKQSNNKDKNSNKDKDDDNEE